LIIGNSAVIVGSGDIGLIMARRLTLEGVDVKCIVEIDKISGGLSRNIRQCVKDFDIPMYFDTSVSEIHGTDRVTGVTLSNGMYIPCDTVILSVGLIPENSRIDHKSPVVFGLVSDKEHMPHDFADSIFICGNALYVHGLVDDVSDSGEHVAEDIIKYISGHGSHLFSKYQLPNIEETRQKERLRIAEKRKMQLEALENGNTEESVTCVNCPNSCEILPDGTGAKCEKGIKYIKEELTCPKRVLTTSVIVWSDIISVRTSVPIPKEHISEAMERIRALRFGPDCAASFRGEPMPPRPMIRSGDVLVKDFMDGADLIATRGNVYL
jgi:CxxC motif-containing protein